MVCNSIIDWLLQGDVSIQYQVYRDLLATNNDDLRNGISEEGWGAKLLSNRNPNGHWGAAFYQPKWTSSHYTLLDLRNLCISPANPIIKESISIILKNEKAADGGLLPIGKKRLTDLCINGMFLNYASYFKTSESDLNTVVDCILVQIMPDGGFNCRSNRYPTVHSSLHTTLSVLEGLTEYVTNGYQYKINEINTAIIRAKEFILLHQLYISDRTGNIIKKDFLKLSYPRRWRYDILSALDYFQYSNSQWDHRMQKAINVLLKKRNKDGTWNVQAKHPGQAHFDMEEAGKSSRWNTLRALRVFKHFKIAEFKKLKDVSSF